jgi:hypothetical protein
MSFFNGLRGYFGGQIIAPAWGRPGRDCESLSILSGASSFGELSNILIFRQEIVVSF